MRRLGPKNLLKNKRCFVFSFVILVLLVSLVSGHIESSVIPFHLSLFGEKGFWCFVCCNHAAFNLSFKNLCKNYDTYNNLT